MPAPQCAFRCEPIDEAGLYVGTLLGVSMTHAWSVGAFEWRVDSADDTFGSFSAVVTNSSKPFFVKVIHHLTLET